MSPGPASVTALGNEADVMQECQDWPFWPANRPTIDLSIRLLWATEQTSVLRCRLWPFRVEL